MADIRITGRMFNLTRLTLDTNDQHAIRQKLTQMLQGTAAYGTLVIIDSTVEQELIALIQLLASLDLQPVGVIDGILSNQERAIQFPIFPTDKQPLQRIKATHEQVLELPAESAEDTAENTAPDEAKPSRTISHVTSYHNEILRTGQCLVQDHGDIILNAGINSGSEVIASGNIHIYGSVRGRVIAGLGGDNAARIFCHSLEAELVSIAGTYCVADDIPPHVLKKSVHIYLNNQQELVFEVLEF